MEENLSASSVNATYWFTVIQLEILLFMLVRSVREANFDLLLRCLQDIIPWLFAMDLVHYSRCMSVFIHDLRRLPDTHPDVFQRFQEGQFTINKSARVFSNMSIDQAHEQNNKLVKIDGGAIGILEEDTALLDWAISGPQISQMLQIFSNSDTNKASGILNDFNLHHEDTDAFEKNFRKDLQALTKAFKCLGNPFLEEESGLVIIATRQVLDDAASKSVQEVVSRFNTKYRIRIERLESKTKSVYENIKMNRQPIFRNKNAVRTGTGKQEEKLLKNERHLYASLYAQSSCAE